ncbi:hypothetical protein ZHAS_00021050 [Anopheles sinensis]|uniref:Uncharacterized protein n=1 Tax=Anopheles sinensis TaxID=74873 RepID=A0A084WRE0_ANOSI|nr:hypothetical protein ZHAS_00021050 [Anopheles sinensis]
MTTSINLDRSTGAGDWRWHGSAHLFAVDQRNRALSRTGWTDRPNEPFSIDREPRPVGSEDDDPEKQTY